MTEQDSGIGYGYQDDASSAGGGLQFGLNAGVTKMIKFEFNPNGGSDGAEQEALDIVFNVDGRDISYRMFPVTKAFDDNGNEVTDPRHPKMKQAMQDYNAVIVHILRAFVPQDAVKQALSVPITSFRQFCEVSRAVLPTGFENKILDIFAQWQWSISGDNDKTYLRLPKNMKHGKWLCQHIPPVGGQWNDIRLNDNLHYEDNEKNRHPFSRQKWFMNSNFAAQQKEEGLDGISSPEAHAPTNQSSEQQTNWT